MKMIFKELKINEVLKIKQLIDSKSTIDLDNHPISHSRSKYIERKYHFLRYQVSKNMLEIEYRKTKLQFVDILTMPLKRARFDCLKKLIEMRKITQMNYEDY